MTPDAALPLVEDFCQRQIPEPMREKVRVQCVRRGNRITIRELRPPWRADPSAEWTETQVAQLRHEPSTGTWSLYGHLSSGRWFYYDQLGPVRSVVPLLDELERDPTGIFWG